MKRLAVIALALLLGAPASAQTSPSPAPETQAPSLPGPGALDPAGAPSDVTDAAPTLPVPAGAGAPTVAPAPTPEQEARAAADFYNSLNRRKGVISIAGGRAALNVPAGYYFLDQKDSRRVLVDIWANPPGSAEGIEGMLLPEGGNPMTGSWAAVIEYSDDGYVSDKDAKTADYAKLMQSMQADVAAENVKRKEDGFDTVNLVGWAETPHYDARQHKVYWAEELAFSDAPRHTLNYRIRVLGREGVLVVNFVAAMDELADIKALTPAVLAIPDFTPGHGYSDYADGDKKAAFGLAGLIAGGVGVAAVQKLGLLGIILAFAKKGLVLIIAFFGAITAWFRNLFGKKRPPAQQAQQAQPDADVAEDAPQAPPPDAPSAPD